MKKMKAYLKEKIGNPLLRSFGFATDKKTFFTTDKEEKENRKQPADRT